MTYALIALFMVSGESFVERQGLTLQSCAGQAAMARQAYLAVLPKLARIGEVRFLCVEEGRS